MGSMYIYKIQTSLLYDTYKISTVTVLRRVYKVFILFYKLHVVNTQVVMSNDYTHILGVHVWVAGYVNNFSNTVQHPSMSKSSTRYSFGVQFGTINYSATRTGANHFKHMRCKGSGSAHPSAWASGRVRRRLEQASTVSRPPANYTTHKVRAHCNVCRLSAETNGHLWGDGRSFSSL